MVDQKDNYDDRNTPNDSWSQTSSKNANNQIEPHSSHHINNEDNQIVKIYKQISLQTKAIVLAIAISTLPVLGIGLWANRLAGNAASEKTYKQQQAIAIGFANQINQLIGERYADITMMANLPGLGKKDSTTSESTQNPQGMLDKLLEVYKAYDSIAVFDLNGDVITQSTGEALANEADRPYFQPVRDTDRPHITQPVVLPTSDQKIVYLAAPVKDPNGGATIGIIRARMPIGNLETVVKNYASVSKGEEYHLIDSSGQIFLSSTTASVGKKIGDEYQPLSNLGNSNQSQTLAIAKQNNSQGELVSYVPLPPLPELSNLQWKVVMATNQANTLPSSREYWQAIAIGTGLTALIVGAITAWLAKRAIADLAQATHAVSKLGEGEFHTRLPIKRADELGILGAKINQTAEQLQLLSTAQISTAQNLDTNREQPMADVTLLTRKSLTFPDIFATSVEQIRYILNADRVIICQFDPHTWKGSIIAESVAVNCSPMMGTQIDNYQLQVSDTQSNAKNRVQVINNIYEANNIPNIDSYIQTWEKYAVKSTLIAPIITQDEVMGLMMVHHCQAPHVWEEREIELFQQLVTQVGYALEQAQVLAELEQAKEKEQQQKEELQNQLLELLKDVEGAASGDLRVRAEITSGEIGIVADFFNSIIESLRLIVTQVQETAIQVNNSLLTNEAATQHLAESALTQTTEINRVLDAVDQMTDSITTLESSVQEAATVANHAASSTQDSGEAMEKTVQNILLLRETVGDTTKKVKRLGESTQQITRVVSLINEIAMQTHLLAINAGIEAARAGEEGEGFAVVAEEVGILATRSSAATQEIEQIVVNIQRETSDLVQAMELGVTQVVEGTQIVKTAKQSLYQIFAMSRQIDDLVQSVSTATTSQVQTAQTVSQLMREIATISQESSESSRQVSASLQQTVEISQQLQATVGTFQVN